jgi:limonene-1,2-epoxide hydrolase
VVRALPLAALAAAALLAGCGGHKPASPEAVVRAWSAAINAGDDEKAAGLFAPGAVVTQGASITLATHGDAVQWNSGLPCAGFVQSVEVQAEQATAVFVLGGRPGHRCGGPGQKAAAIFTVHDGKIVSWEEIAVPGSPAAPAAPQA